MCEAEYIAASEVANEGVWMKEFISDLGVIPIASGPMKIFYDNTGEICPRGNNKVVIYISLYHDKCLLFMLELY